MRKKRRSAYLLESLEARLLFSADLAPVPVDGGTTGAEFESDLEISLQPDSAGVQEADENTQKRQEVIFVDSGVDDYQQLIDDIESQLEKGRQFDIVNLDSNSDGIDQISAYLRQHEEIDAVHVVSHGSEDAVKLGNVWLTPDKLDAYTDTIEGWQQALSSDADLLFYGCNLAADDGGQDLVNSLSLLTNADVAASDDLTGNVDLGGDWDLEYSKGKIETAVAINNAIQQNWNGVLASFTVDTTADTVDANPGDGVAEDAFGNTSLRAAIMEANALAGADSITLSAGTYSISIAGTGDDVTLTGDLDITSDLTITGMGAGVTVIDGGGLDRVFHIDWAGNATITNLTIQNGGNVTHGGGIRVSGGGGGGRLNLENVIVHNNTASGNGGGIFVDGVVTLNNVEISGNTTSGTGGGLSNDEQATLTGVTISGNSAADGGGIYNSNQGNLLELTNVTVSGNTATANGGGIYTAELVKLTNVTLTSNLGGGGIYSTGGQGDVQLKNSILANNTGGNSNLPLTSLGYNIEDGNSAFTSTTGDQPNTDPLIGPMQLNGGFTQTHALLAGSPAIDPAGLSGAPSQDQRGYARDVTPDIGAFEYNVSNTAPTITSVTGAPMVDEDAVYSLDLTFTDPDDSTVTWTVNWGDGQISSALSTGATTTLTHTYTQPGFTYNILVSANDGDVTVLQNELLVPSYAAGDSIFRYEETTGAFLQEFATANGLDDPIQAIIGPDGNLYVTSEKSNQVLRYNAVTGAFIDEFVSAGSGGLNEPGGLAFGPDGNLYVSSFATDEVLRYDGTSGAFIDAFVIAGSGGLNGPYGLTFGSDGNLYIASYLDSQVLRYNGTTGAFIDEFVSSGSGGMSTPEQMIFGPDGNLYIASFDSNNVLRYNGTTGAFIDTFVAAGVGGLDHPSGLSFGPDGNLYVADHQDEVILRYNGTTGAFIDEYVSAGSGGLVKPLFISFLPKQQVLVNSVNDAPTLSGGPYNLGSTDEDSVSTGEQVATILGGLTSSDADGDTLGIAVITASGNGTWQYSTNSTDGTDGTWTAFGSVDSSNALLLSNSSWVRYIPDGLNGENVNIDFHVWDGTTGTASIDGTPSTADPAGGGGTTAYSSGIATANLTVTSQNDAPTINSSAGYGVSEDDNYRILSSISIDDVDAGGADVQVTMDVANGVLRIGNPAGLTSITGNDSASVVMVGSVTNINGALATLAYKPNPDFAGNDNPSITVNDLGNTGGGGPQVANKNVSLTVTPVNDPGTVTIDNTTPTQGDTLTASVSDPDGSTGGISYQWYRDGVAIGGATSSTYTTVPADVGSAITVTASYTDDMGTAESPTSTPTAAVTSLNQAPDVNDQTSSVDENAANGTLVGTVAATDSGPADNYTMLYWVDVQTDELRRINLDGTCNEQLAIQADGTAATGMRSVAVDDVNGKVYWVNNNSDQIWRANLDGSTPEQILSGIVWPMGIAVDAAGEKIYWFDNNSSELWWADLDGANAAALITAGINHPKALTIDAIGGKLYWTDWGLDTIMRANLDGSNLETVVAGLDDPYGIALDTTAGKVYWAESMLGEIQRADMVVGATAETVITGLSEPRAVTVDTINGKLYYADAGVDRIERANLDGSAIEIVTATGDWPTSLAIGPPVQNLTYAITGGNTNGAFTIDSVTGAITVANSSELDFETTPVFNLTVTVTDAGGLADSATITINLNDINEAPSAVALDNTTVAENDDGAVIGSLTTNDPDSGDTHTYTVDDARFEVVAGQLKLKAGQTLDLETEPSVNLNITSTDAGGLSTVQGFTLTVNNVNEAPSAVALDNTTVAENDDGAVIGNLTTTDPDSGDTHTYTVDDARFEVVAGQLKLRAGQTLDFETEPNVNLNITSTDAGGLSTVQGFTLTVNNVNEAPSAVALDNTTVAENDNGAIIGNLTTTDPDSGDTHTYTVDDARFEVVAGQLKLRAGQTLDFETEPNVNLNITSTDAGGLSTVQGFTLTVNNVNEAPSAVALDNTTVAENDNGAIIGNLTTTDPDSGDTHTYTVDDARFEVVAGQLKLRAGQTLDFETEPNVNLNITSTDAGGLSTVQGFTLTVNNVNEAPSAVALDNTTVAENDNGAIIGNLTTTDPDSGDTHTYTVDDARFEVVAGQLKLRAGQTLDFETEPNVNLNITSTDAGGLSTVQGFTLTVNNVNEAPSAVALDNTTVAENDDGAIIGNLTTTDPDSGDTHTYTVDDARFEVVAGQLKLRAGQTLDFETEPNVNLNITSTDAGGLSTVQGFTLTVNNVNEAPSAVALDNTTVAENDDGAIIGNLTTTDPDSGDTHTYTVDDARFEVVAGQLKLRAGQTLDFETEPNVNLNITSTDAGGLSTVQGFTLTVNNVNEAPSAVALDNTTVAENDDGAIIGNLTTTDPDSGDTHTYTVDDARFEVVAGQLKLRAGQTLDFETEPNVNLNITSTDAGGLSTVQGFTLTVNNVNDVGSVTIDNMSPAQGDTLTANVIDPDGISGAITYQWFSDGAVIGGATGKTYTTTQTDVGAIMTVTAIYTDDQGTAESLTSLPTAPVTNVNDTPIAVNDNLNAIEDQSMTFTSVTDLLGNDSDIDGDTLTISSFNQPANGSLADNGDGTVTYTSAGNFSGVDNFTYTISDNKGGTASGAAIIVVTPVGDTPQVTNVSTDAGIQSGPINIDRNVNDGAEVTHFKISGITNGILYLADGVSRIDNGDFISVGQGQAGLRFTPAANSAADGSFNVESSEDGVSVASQSGIATSIISILTTAPQPSGPVPSLPPSGPEEVVSEETELEETEELEDVADETDVQAVADDMASVEAPQNTKSPGVKKASLVPGISVFRRADLNSSNDRTPGRSMLLSPQTLKKLVESENLGELKTALRKLDITTLPPDVYELVRGSLDAVQEEMGKEILIGKTVVGSAIATSVGLSAGYVVWMLKGGSLLASVLSSLPAWQLADPLAILVGTKEDEDDDDDTLETIIKDGSRRNEDKERKASELNKRKKEPTKR